jgi:hypothetical protein
VERTLLSAAFDFDFDFDFDFAFAFDFAFVSLRVLRGSGLSVFLDHIAKLTPLSSSSDSPLKP